MADIETHPDPDVFGVLEYLISQVEHIKPESKSSIDETIAAVAAASSSTVETVQKKKRALRDRTNIPAATTADGETPKKRGRKRKSDELPPQPQPPTTATTTATTRSTRSAEKRKHEDENQTEDNKENAAPQVTKRQRTPRKQGAQLRAQHKPELEEQMPPRPSHTAILPPGEETGSLECECYPDPAYDRQMKQLPLLSEFVTNNAANRGISHDIPPQIASSNMTFNRLTTQAQFAFGQAYEVYTDECGLTVCYSAAPPIQHCINEIESLMDDSKTSATAAAEEEEESTQVEVENREEDDNDKENKKEEKVVAKEEKPKKSNSGLRFDSPIPDQENQRHYIYNGSNLSLFGGPTLVLYAFNVARSIFTNDELSNGLLPDEKLHVRSSNKKFLDPERIEVLKEAIAAKFNTTKDMVPWKELRAKLNSKFGYLTRKSKELRKASSASNSSIVS